MLNLGYLNENLFNPPGDTTVSWMIDLAIAWIDFIGWGAIIRLLQKCRCANHPALAGSPEAYSSQTVRRVRSVH